MVPNRHNDPVLARVVEEVERLYGDRLQGLVLFGSRARGDHHPDSDYDIGVLIDRVSDHWSEVAKLAQITTTILIDLDAYVSLKPWTTHKLQEASPLMVNVRREAIPV